MCAFECAYFSLSTQANRRRKTGSSQTLTISSIASAAAATVFTSTSQALRSWKKWGEGGSHLSIWARLLPSTRAERRGEKDVIGSHTLTHTFARRSRRKYQICRPHLDCFPQLTRFFFTHGPLYCTVCSTIFCPSFIRNWSKCDTFLFPFSRASDDRCA